MPSHLALEMQEEAASLIQEQQAPHRGRALKAVAALACVVGAAACGRALAGARPAKSLAAGAVSMQEDAAAVGEGAGEAGESWSPPSAAAGATMEDADASGDESAGVDGDEGAGADGDEGADASGEYLGEEEMDNYCPSEGEDCTRKRCCAKPGLQCYKKNEEWAGCMTNCTKGMKMAGDKANETWDCEEFGPRHPEPVHEDYSYCAPRGQDCRHNHCCAGADDHCYLKNAAWGSCMMKCDPFVALTKDWECTKLY